MTMRMNACVAPRRPWRGVVCLGLVLGFLVNIDSFQIKGFHGAKQGGLLSQRRRWSSQHLRYHETSASLRSPLVRLHGEGSDTGGTGTGMGTGSASGTRTTYRVPRLPADALIISAADEGTWELEKKEFERIEASLEAPNSFAPRLESFALDGSSFLHAFTNVGAPLASIDFPGVVMKRDDCDAPLPVPVGDALKLTLVRDLMDAVHWCHLQGLPHLSLDNKCVRVFRDAQVQGDSGSGSGTTGSRTTAVKKRGFWRLNLIGLGAGPQMVTRDSPFQVGNESWPFNPPETLTGALIKGNLPGLYAWDSWSVGVLLTMLVGGYTESPFASAPEFRSLTFSTQAAVNKRIKEVFSDYSAFLTKLNQDSDGLLFRHGWLVEVITGLLKPNANERMNVVAAWEVMTAALSSQRGSKGGNGSRQQQQQPQQQQQQQGRRSRQLSQPDLTKLRRTFDSFDTDRSGDISEEEIVTALAAMGTSITRDQAAKLMSESDANGDGKIDFDEFVAMAKDLVDEEEGLSAKEIFGRRVSSTQGEPFRSLESMINIADKGLCEVSIQVRADEATGESVLKNYGEIVGFRNRADGDRWDIFAPGLKDQLPDGSRHRLTAVFGVLLIKGGNHKLVVELRGSRPDPETIKQEIQTFIEEYSRTHANVRGNKRIRYLELEDPYARPAGLLEIDPSLLTVPEDGESWISSTFQ